MNRKVKKALKIVGITITGFIAAVVVSLGCLCIYHQCRLKKNVLLTSSRRRTGRLWPLLILKGHISLFPIPLPDLKRLQAIPAG